MKKIRMVRESVARKKLFLYLEAKKSKKGKRKCGIGEVLSLPKSREKQEWQEKMWHRGNFISA